MDIRNNANKQLYIEFTRVSLNSTKVYKTNKKYTAGTVPVGIIFLFAKLKYITSMQMNISVYIEKTLSFVYKLCMQIMTVIISTNKNKHSTILKPIYKFFFHSRTYFQCAKIIHQSNIPIDRIHI